MDEDRKRKEVNPDGRLSILPREAELVPDRFQHPLPTVLKSINKRRFLEELRKRGPSTRAQLTRAIGVAPPTSSSIIADLLEAGFLEQGTTDSSGKGRPGTFFKLASKSAYVIGGTLDIYDCQVASSGLDGKTSQSQVQVFKTPETYDKLIAETSSAIRYATEHAEGKCLGVGLAVPGLIDGRHHRVAFSPNLHILDGRDLGADLTAKVGLKVVCTQEEHALCLSEQNQGEAANLSDFAVVDFSSGVGMGVVSGGRYVAGVHGFAGEIGHTTVDPGGRICGCGNRGCLETVASDPSLLRSLSESLGRPVDFEEIRRHWNKGDDQVMTQVEATLAYIAIGLSTVINIFNPQVVFINGRLLSVSPDILTQLQAMVAARSLKPSFAAVQIRGTTGNKLQGAIAGLLDQLFAEVGPILG
jgi:predicted NBD/HSP70 family sugar kinase